MNQENLQLLDSVDKFIINMFQDNFPVTPRPYKQIAEQCSITEAEVIKRLNRLKKNKILSRIGAIITPNTIGVSTLCAMAVANTEIDKIAQIINSFDEVNHNYQRSHEFNLWFVITAQNQQHLSKTLDSISQKSGLKVLSLPLEAAYYLNLGFEID